MTHTNLYLRIIVQCLQIYTMWIFIFCIGYFSHSVRGTTVIAETLHDTFVTTGSNATLSCVVTGKGQSQIQWWYVSGKTSISIGLKLGVSVSPTKYFVEESQNIHNRTTSTLTVRSFSKNDEGLYRCVVRIPRVHYPAWPKENAFIRITDSKDMVTVQTTQRQTDNNTASDQSSIKDNHNVSSTLYSNILLFVCSTICALSLILL